MLFPANLLSINFNTSIFQSKPNFFVAIKSVVFPNPLSLLIIDRLDIHKKVLFGFPEIYWTKYFKWFIKISLLEICNMVWIWIFGFGFEYLGCKKLHEWLSCNFTEELFKTSISHNSYKNFWKQWNGQNQRRNHRKSQLIVDF